MEEDIQAMDEAVVGLRDNHAQKGDGAVSVVKAEEFMGYLRLILREFAARTCLQVWISLICPVHRWGDMAITVRGYNSMDVEAGRRFRIPYG